LIQASIADGIGELGLPFECLRLGFGTTGVVNRDWRSGALGCPEPGMNYTQALVPGALIILAVGKETHGYHAKLGGKPFYCPSERAEEPVYGQDSDMT